MSISKLKRNSLNGGIPQKAGKGLFHLLRGHKFLFAVAILMQACAVAMGTLGNFLLRTYVDEYTRLENWVTPLIYFALAYLALALFRGLFSFISGRGTAMTAEKITRKVRNNLFNHMQKLSFTYHDNMKTGELIQRSTSDVDKVKAFYDAVFSQLARISFMFLINFVSILYLNWKLGLVSVIAIPLIALLSTIFFKKIHKTYDAYQVQDGKVSSAIQENLTGVRVVKAFARQEFEKSKFDEFNHSKMLLGFKHLMVHSLYWPFSHIICALQMVAGIVIAGIMTINGDISLGTMLAYSGMVNTIIWPIQQMGRLITQISETAVSYGRIADILREEQEDLNIGFNDENQKIEGKLHFNQVNFAYQNSDRVLKDVSFDVEPGQTIALLGETGSGKTSLVNLLPRFYDYNTGNLSLDGKELNSFSRHFLRRQIGIVEQEPFLFSTTIKENITYGVDRDVTSEEVVNAAKAASIHESIINFTEGYDTIVGEKGVTLSGGQKQRIAIARTLLKNPGILILDDSTSAVDSETEQKIRQAIGELKKGRTTFLIAHRVQSLIDADLILVFKDGEIIQRGKHDDLIDVEGFYKHVFDLQTRIETELDKELANV